MARWIPAVLAALLVTPGAASAQVAMAGARAPGVHFSPPVLKAEPPPSRPDPPPPPSQHQPRFEDHFTPFPGEEDLFRARPETYRLRKDASLFFRRANFFPGLVAYPGSVAPEVVVQPIVVERVVIVDREEPAPPTRGSAEAAVEPPAPPPPVIVGVRKPVYVIPRCYAGDKPPEVSRLPAGCDVKDMRVIPAR